MKFDTDVPIEEDHGYGRTAIIIGAPGSGKTTILTEIVSRAVSTYGFDAVTICSFTVAAAREISSRVSAPIPTRQVGTLHSMCRRLIGGPRLHLEVIKSWNDLRPDWALSGGRGADADLDLDGPKFGSEGEALLNEIGILRNRMIPEDDWPGHLMGFHRAWEQWKADEDVVDFTDLLAHALDLTHAAPGAPAVLLVDEAQDSTTLQFALLRKWSLAAKWSVLVGDVDQCLYEWAGVARGEFLTWEADYTIPWNQSHRVPRKVAALAVNWIHQVDDRPPVDLLPRDFEGEITVLDAPFGADREGFIDRLEGYHRAGQTSMVLASCAYMLNPVVSAMREHGLPFHNPLRPTNGSWNPLPRRLRTVSSADRLLAFLRPDETVWDDEARMWTAADLWRWMSPLRTKGVLRPRVKAWLERHHERLPTGSLALNDSPPPSDFELPGVLWFFEKHTWPRVFDMDVEWWIDNMLEADKRRAEFPWAVFRRFGRDALEQRPTTFVGTMNSSKGGQADHVFVMSDLSVKGWRQYQEDPDPVVRLFYVALTRARQAVHIVPGSSGRQVDLVTPALRLL